MTDTINPNIQYIHKQPHNSTNTLYRRINTANVNNILYEFQQSTKDAELMKWFSWSTVMTDLVELYCSITSVYLFRLSCSVVANII